MSEHLSRRELAAANARLAAFEVVYEVGVTLRWLEQLAAADVHEEFLGAVQEHSDRDPREALRRTIEDHGVRVDRSVRSLQAAVQAAVNLELLLAERRAGG